ncbi:hypothetical protein ACVGW3_14685, partial [Enterobacter hormaechei]
RTELLFSFFFFGGEVFFFKRQWFGSLPIKVRNTELCASSNKLIGGNLSHYDKNPGGCWFFFSPVPVG